MTITVPVPRNNRRSEQRRRTRASVPIPVHNVHLVELAAGDGHDGVGRQVQQTVQAEHVEGRQPPAQYTAGIAVLLSRSRQF